MAEKKTEKQVKTDFEKLYEINVNDKTEKKNGLTYLSWAYAWAEFKKVHPNATYEIKKFEGGIPYAYDENTGYMVYTSVTVDDLTHEMWLPVMDYKNAAMKSVEYNSRNGKVAPATMFDINKTIMRCLTKNLAMFGLGLYIYAGEDLPEDAEQVAKEEAKQTKAVQNEAPKQKAKAIKESKPTSVDSKITYVKKMLEETKANVPAFLEYFSDKYEREIKSVDQMVEAELNDAIKMLDMKKADQDKTPKKVDMKGAING